MTVDTKEPIAFSPTFENQKDFFKITENFNQYNNEALSTYWKLHDGETIKTRRADFNRGKTSEGEQFEILSPEVSNLSTEPSLVINNTKE